MEPKILIISERFKAGDAITGLNLFSLWNKDSLYCASRSSDFCHSFNSFYLIGDKEITFNNLLRHFNKLPDSGVVKNNNLSKHNNRKVQSLVGYLYLECLIPLLQLFGLFHKRVVYHLSTSFLDWVDTISPDYVYTSVGSYNMAQIISDLMEVRPHLKYIIHGYDDWVEHSYYSLFSNCKRDSTLLLSSIISHATLTFATSDKMAEDYMMKYQRRFLSFPNPVKIISESGIKAGERRGITFVGKVLRHNIKSILCLARCLSQLNMDLELNIYSDVSNSYKTRIKKAYVNTRFHGWINHNEIPQILCNSQILYLPISINKQTIKFTKYSMSTKMSEYLSSGVPILYHGPDGIAMTELLERYNCAFLVKDYDVVNLKKVISNILLNDSEKQEMLKRAMNLFKEKFEMMKISSDFKKVIIEDFQSQSN